MTPLVISELLLLAVCGVVVIAAFRFRPWFFVPKRVKEDRARQIVEIDGVELSGHISSQYCAKCGERLVYYERFDDRFCPQCNEWAQPAPNDSEFKRPERPLPILSDDKRAA